MTIKFSPETIELRNARDAAISLVEELRYQLANAMREVDRLQPLYEDAVADDAVCEGNRECAAEEEDGPCRGADAGCSCGAPGCVDYSVDRSLDNHADDCAECQDLPIDEAGDE